MKLRLGSLLLLVSSVSSAASAQVPLVEPRVLTEADQSDRVTTIEIAPRFVTAIGLPETVSSVVVGDPSKFQVEHSDHEAKLVFVKALSATASETNLLISTVNGHDISLLLVNRGDAASDPRPIDFLVKYEIPRGFLVNPSEFPFALVGETAPLFQNGEGAGGLQPPLAFLPGSTSVSRATRNTDPPTSNPSTHATSASEIDRLLEQQKRSPLPSLYGEHTEQELASGDRVRAGVSEVIDGGERVVVLFSVVNPTKHAILLMPPQIQLGGTTTSGKLVHHRRWSTAEQLPIDDFRLNPRRLGPGERANGVVVFVRPPYKQSNETLFLQMAESGAVDRPALAPIGFGVSTSWEEPNHGSK